MISDRLFVYGTLMRGFDHPMAKLLSRSADFLGERAMPRPALSDQALSGAGAVGRSGRHRVRRTVSPARSRDALLREFDMYEACGEGFAGADRICQADAAGDARTAAARARRGPISTTGRSPTCRASPRGGFWRGRSRLFSPLPLAGRAAGGAGSRSASRALSRHHAIQERSCSPAHRPRARHKSILRWRAASPTSSSNASACSGANSNQVRKSKGSPRSRQ